MQGNTGQYDNGRAGQIDFGAGQGVHLETDRPEKIEVATGTPVIDIVSGRRMHDGPYLQIRGR